MPTINKMAPVTRSHARTRQGKACKDVLEVPLVAHLVASHLLDDPMALHGMEMLSRDVGYRDEMLLSWMDMLNIKRARERKAWNVQHRLFTDIQHLVNKCEETPILERENAMFAIYEYVCVNSTEIRMVEIKYQYYPKLIRQFDAKLATFEGNGCARITARCAMYRERLSDLFEWARIRMYKK